MSTINSWRFVLMNNSENVDQKGIHFIIAKKMCSYSVILCICFNNNLKLKFEAVFYQLRLFSIVLFSLSL